MRSIEISFVVCGWNMQHIEIGSIGKSTAYSSWCADICDRPDVQTHVRKKLQWLICISLDLSLIGNLLVFPVVCQSLKGYREIQGVL